MVRSGSISSAWAYWEPDEVTLTVDGVSTVLQSGPIPVGNLVPSEIANLKLSSFKEVVEDRQCGELDLQNMIP